MSIVGIACFALFVLVFWMFMKPRKKGKLPPAPKGNFIAGNALQLGLKRFAVQLGEIGKDFGDAYTVRIFTEQFIILNSYEMIREVMTSPKYAQIVSGRPPSFLGDYVLKRDAILQTYSVEWAVLRKLVFRGLKTYGTHMAAVEDLIQEELKHLVSRIQKDTGKSVDPYDYISGYVLSIISMLLTGKHLKHDDPRLYLYNQVTVDGHALCHPLADYILTTFPWLRHIPLGLGKVYKRLRENMKILEKEVQLGIQNRENREQCFLDYMLEEERKGHVTKESITSILGDLFVAGTATTRSSLHILLLVLASKLDVQKRVQQEVDREIGTSRLPCAEDKHKMPYTEAVLWELFRLFSAAPITSPHCTMEDVEIRDYFLPKDTVVYYNIWNVLHDEGLWEHPWVFNPSRFLDDSGNLIPPEDEKRQRMIAFGVGKRLCTGEVLARLRIFMACVAILQNFTILPDPDFPLPSIDPRTFDVHFILAAPRYRISFKPRVSC